MLCWFRVYSKVTQLYRYCFFFFQILLPYKSLQFWVKSPALSSRPWLIISYIQSCVCVHPRLLVYPWCIPPHSLSPRVKLSLFSKSVSLFSFVNKIIYINFLKLRQHTRRESKQSTFGSISESLHPPWLVWAPPETLLFLSPLCLSEANHSEHFSEPFKQKRLTRF